MSTGGYTHCPWSNLQIKGVCVSTECARCGWNPDVHNQRVKVIRQLEECGKLQTWGKTHDTFKTRLKFLCDKSGISAHTIAELCGISSNLVGMYLSGVCLPRVSTLIKIADYFGVSVDYLLGRKNS